MSEPIRLRYVCYYDHRLWYESKSIGAEGDYLALPAAECRALLAERDALAAEVAKGRDHSPPVGDLDVIESAVVICDHDVAGKTLADGVGKMRDEILALRAEVARLKAPTTHAPYAPRVGHVVARSDESNNEAERGSRRVVVGPDAFVYIHDGGSAEKPVWTLSEIRHRFLRWSTEEECALAGIPWHGHAKGDPADAPDVAPTPPVVAFDPEYDKPLFHCSECGRELHKDSCAKCGTEDNPASNWIPNGRKERPTPPAPQLDPERVRLAVEVVVAWERHLRSATRSSGDAHDDARAALIDYCDRADAWKVRGE